MYLPTDADDPAADERLQGQKPALALGGEARSEEHAEEENHHPEPGCPTAGGTPASSSANAGTGNAALRLPRLCSGWKQRTCWKQRVGKMEEE